MKNDKIKGYMLSSGMEILGTYDTEDVGIIYLDKVVTFHLGEDPKHPGKVSLKFIPPTLFGITDEKGSMKLALNKAAVIFSYEPKDDLYEMYNTATSTIVVVPAGSIRLK